MSSVPAFACTARRPPAYRLLAPPSSSPAAPLANTVLPSRHTSKGLRSVTVPPSSTVPCRRPSLPGTDCSRPDTSMRLVSPNHNTPYGSGSASLLKPDLLRLTLPPGSLSSPSMRSVRAALIDRAAAGSSVMRAPSATVSTPPSATLLRPLAFSVRLTGGRRPARDGARTGATGPSPTRLPVAKVRIRGLVCQLDSSGDSCVPDTTSSCLTPSTVKPAKPPCEKNDSAKRRRPAEASMSTCTTPTLGPITTSLARRLRLALRAPARAAPRSAPFNMNGVPANTLPSTSGLDHSVMLPALPPLRPPLLLTRSPPETSIKLAVPSTTPAPERRLALPPLVGRLLVWPSSNRLAARPARSICAPCSTRMSPARLLLPAAVTRPLVDSATLPPAATMSLASVKPPAPRAAITSTARAGSTNPASASVARSFSVASVMLPKPPACRARAATCDSAGSAACCGNRQKSAPSAVAVATSRSEVSTPVPPKPLLPKLPPLSTRPSWKREAPASASSPPRWRSPCTVLPCKSPASSACAAVTSNWPPARPSA